MKTITQVTVQQKNKKRSNLFLDGVYYCSLDNLLVVKYSLKAGVKITKQKLAEIQEENEFSYAFDLALGYISRYRKTKKQLIEYLLKKGYLPTLANKVVDKLSSYGYLDDKDYARVYAEQNSKTKGKILIKMQLKAKGIDEQTANIAVENLGDETPQVIELAKKYLKNKEKDFKTLSKCYRYLLSKGFSYDAVSSAIDSLKDEYNEN
ncbi:MAG: RecX family transcriptional regulator [Clostridia bacterium]|nr:RecX family transcriptional regulator [Clostridia bacterium]